MPVEQPRTEPAGTTRKPWRFADILDQPGIRERWEKVRRWFFLRESTYDMTRRCNIRCNGCYYYEGDKQFADENRDPAAWRELMRREKARGITFVCWPGRNRPWCQNCAGCATRKSRWAPSPPTA